MAPWFPSGGSSEFTFSFIHPPGPSSPIQGALATAGLEDGANKGQAAEIWVDGGRAWESRSSQPAHPRVEVLSASGSAGRRHLWVAH